MKRSYLSVILFSVCIVICISLIADSNADTWTDNFDGNKLEEGWEFRDHNNKQTEYEVKDGFLHITNPGNWGHTTADKPMIERDIPDSASDDITVSGIFSSDPDKPADAWIGIFIYSDDQLNYACLLFGGESNLPQKALIGSMIKSAWNDHGHPQMGFDVPLHLKLVKEGDTFSGYFRKDDKDDWSLAQNKSWNHNFKVKKVGIGFMNNWGGQTVTLLIDQLSIEGAGIKPFLVEPSNKLATTWGALKKD